MAADWPETQPLPDTAQSALADYRRAQLKTNQ
ncbi:hypothetical protein Lxx13860 [Leifsonia xyli subsp. xyli str. CTCB07]|uniref:Uncharacterized protein n=1 Tax=Leifsonia xyli subsp. xyli (strain CTCB07) TaxID=281090 RepID=Q6AEI8_LEIXX|nr:hypothetical protein Lxx13860 [Leifsonia xyli subsp. xyli str. CTCB07]